MPGMKAPHSPAMTAECTSVCRSTIGSRVVSPRLTSNAVSSSEATPPTRATRSQ
jgi:hypothetical protein